jgi:hypothetical protein
MVVLVCWGLESMKKSSSSSSRRKSSASMEVIASVGASRIWGFGRRDETMWRMSCLIPTTLLGVQMQMASVGRVGRNGIRRHPKAEADFGCSCLG